MTHNTGLPESERYAAAMRQWFTENQHNRDRGRAPDPFPAPPQEWYEEAYRMAREELRRPHTKADRKYWQRQLWTTRVCLKNYFGAEPPSDDGNDNSQDGA